MYSALNKSLNLSLAALRKNGKLSKFPQLSAQYEKKNTLQAVLEQNEPSYHTSDCFQLQRSNNKTLFSIIRTEFILNMHTPLHAASLLLQTVLLLCGSFLQPFRERGLILICDKRTSLMVTSAIYVLLIKY